MEALRAAGQMLGDATEGVREGGVAKQLREQRQLSPRAAAPPAPAPLSANESERTRVVNAGGSGWAWAGGAGAAAYPGHVGGAPMGGAWSMQYAAMLDASAHFDSRGPCFPQLAQHPHGGLYGGGGELHGSAALYAPSGESVARPAGTSAPQTMRNFGAAAATAAGVGAKPMYSAAAAQQAVYGAPHGLVPPHPQLAGTNWMPIPAVWQFPGLAPGVMDPRVGGGFEHSAAAAAMMYPAMLLHAQAMVTAAAAEAATRRESERKRLQRERAMLGAPGGAKSRFTGVSWHKPTQRWQVRFFYVPLHFTRIMLTV